MKSIFEIMISSACNARCPYCYESNSPIATMTPAIEHATVAMIEKTARQGHEIKVVWFGGEPLLFPTRIFELAKQLDEVFAASKTKHFSTLITNGAAVKTPEALKLFESGYIDAVQVSMDGFGEDHMKRKRYVDSGLGFDDICDGIETLLEFDFKVTARLNLGRNNLKSLVRLADYLAERFSNDLLSGKFRRYPAVLYGDWISENSDILAPGEIERHYETIAARCGLSDCWNCIAGSCFMDHYAYVIAPDGIVYPCEHLVGKESSVLGNVLDFDSISLDNTSTHCSSCFNKITCHQGCFNLTNGSPIQRYCWKKRAHG